MTAPRQFFIGILKDFGIWIGLKLKNKCSRRFVYWVDLHTIKVRLMDRDLSGSRKHAVAVIRKQSKNVSSSRQI